MQTLPSKQPDPPLREQPDSFACTHTTFRMMATGACPRKKGKDKPLFITTKCTTTSVLYRGLHPNIFYLSPPTWFLWSANAVGVLRASVLFWQRLQWVSGVISGSFAIILQWMFHGLCRNNPEWKCGVSSSLLCCDVKGVGAAIL